MVNKLIAWVDSPPLALRLKVVRTATWVSYCGLLVTLFLNGLQQSAPLSIHLFTLVPLLIFLPGLIKENYRSLSLLCFACLMYFTLITVNLFEPNRTVLDIIEMVFVSVLFVMGMFYSRWQREKLVSQQ